MLEWQECTIGYRQDLPVFQRFSLTVEDSLVMVGPTGGGKSTLLASLLGQVPYVTGRVSIAGQPVMQNPEMGRRLVSYLPSANVLPFDVTPAEYLTELGRLDGLPWRVARHQAEHMAGRLHLSEVLKRPIRRLSGGMKRRTLLAGALLKPAQWLLIDEPTRGLDPEEQQTVMDLLQQESTQRGLIVVTQRLEEAEILQKRVVLVDSGHIRFDGTPEALAAQARDHVFRVSSELPVADFSLWQPLVQPFGTKVYHAQSVEGGQALVPTLEDGYFWTLLADEERAQGV